MQPLFDMLSGAQNGQAIERMAQQFGLSQQQAELAVEALAPAFSTGLKRNAADPSGVAAFMQALASGNHGKYYDDMANAFAPSGQQEGNDILGHLFGSKDVSRAVADQASQATGIGQEVLKQMLPVLASTLMGGMFKQTTQPQAFGASSSNNPFGQIVEQMMRQTTQVQEQTQQTSPRNPNPFDNPFGKALEEIFGGGAAKTTPEPSQPKQSTNPFDADNNPFGKMYEEMMGGGARQAEPAHEPAKGNYDDLFGEMFETGRKTQETYQKSVDSIFDQYLDGMKNLQR